MKIPLKNMHGQSYADGVQYEMKTFRYSKQNPEHQLWPFYVPCATRSPNIVLSDAAQSLLEAAEFFGILQQICNFLAPQLIVGQY
ncbi:hypothetical protein AVEN_135373-1 [Araneus ventricosus]|uniref:Uncharacterized protein n=1 Tax=Araneus ventricosus TaxID=182803 RepID=A0A4Y2K0K1_ARAVE|nr:hypothetical protein AVEN_135373-1 [Araneus ventricosus]